MLDETCIRPTLIRYNCLWSWGTHCKINQRQDKAHSQTYRKHAQASTGHKSTEDQSKHTTYNHRHGASAKTKRLTKSQTGMTNTHTGARNAQQGKARVCAHRGHAVEAPGNGTWPGAPPFSMPLAADRVCSCHRWPTKPVESGRGWPARQHWMSNWESFNNAMCQGEKVLRMYQPAVPSPWATPGAFPTFFASLAFHSLHWAKTGSVFYPWFLGRYATTQLTTPLQQRRIRAYICSISHTQASAWAGKLKVPVRQQIYSITHSPNIVFCVVYICMNYIHRQVYGWVNWTPHFVGTDLLLLTLLSGVLRCGVVCCSVVQWCVAGCGLLCVAERVCVLCSWNCSCRLCSPLCCSVLQCVAVCITLCTAWCSEAECGTVWCSALQCVAVCCSALHCVAVCCSVV